MVRKLLLTAAFALSSLVATGAAWADITILVPSGSEGDGLRAAAADYSKLKGTQGRDRPGALQQRVRAGGQCRPDQVRRVRHRADGRSLDSVLRRERASRGPDRLLQEGRRWTARTTISCRSRWRSAATPTTPAPYVCIPYVGNAQMFFYDAAKFKEAGLSTRRRPGTTCSRRPRRSPTSRRRPLFRLCLPRRPGQPGGRRLHADLLVLWRQPLQRRPHAR